MIHRNKRTWVRSRHICPPAVTPEPEPPALMDFEDTFTRANQKLQGDVTETDDRLWWGNRVAGSSDDAAIVSNVVTSSGGAYAFIVKDIEDGKITVYALNTGVAGGFGVFAMLRATGPSHQYYARIAPSTAAWTIGKNVDGVDTTLASGFSASAGQTIIFEVIGTTLNLYNPVISSITPVLTAIDSALTRGMMGFLVSGAVSVAGVEGVET